LRHEPPPVSSVVALEVVLPPCDAALLRVLANSVRVAVVTTVSTTVVDAADSDTSSSTVGGGSCERVVFRKDGPRNPERARSLPLADAGEARLVAMGALVQPTASFPPSLDGDGDVSASSFDAKRALLRLITLWSDPSSSCTKGSGLDVEVTITNGLRISVFSVRFRSKYLSFSLMVLPKRVGELGGMEFSPFADTCGCLSPSRLASVVFPAEVATSDPSPLILSLPRFRPGLRGGPGIRLLSD
jgi:hypothetical protein